MEDIKFFHYWKEKQVWAVHLLLFISPVLTLLFEILKVGVSTALFIEFFKWTVLFQLMALGVYTLLFLALKLCIKKGW